MVSISTITIQAGDFKKNSQGLFTSDGRLKLTSSGDFFSKWYQISEVSTLEPASEDNVKRVGGTLGWGAIGGAVLGPIGLLAGLLAGGRGKDVTFICVFKDGRKFLGTMDSKAFIKMSAYLFK